MLYSLWGHYGSYADAANNNFDASISCGYDQPYWTPENPINDYARIGSKNLGTHYVNKSFIRLDNITVSYRLQQTCTIEKTGKGQFMANEFKSGFLYSTCFTSSKYSLF